MLRKKHQSLELGAMEGYTVCGTLIAHHGASNEVSVVTGTSAVE
jgi:hypothetical protein